MSEDPLDPSDWREDDSEERADEGSDDADPFADVAADRDGDPFEELKTPPDGPSAGSAGADQERGPRGTRSENDQPGESAPADRSGDGAPADRSGDGGETDDASAWQPLPEVSEASTGGEENSTGEGSVPTAGGAGVPVEEQTLEPRGGADEPFGDPDPRGDPFDEEVFERREVGTIDPDDVWEDLAATEQVGSDDQRRYDEVSKHTYCEGCEWLSAPPEVSCTHEGTEIVEFLDMETVRLVNCPVVEERHAIRSGD